MVLYRNIKTHSIYKKEKSFNSEYVCLELIVLGNEPCHLGDIIETNDFQKYLDDGKCQEIELDDLILEYRKKRHAGIVRILKKLKEEEEDYELLYGPHE